MKRSAFTMIELIIVIVVGGILAAVMIPRLERDPTRAAAKEIVRHIQYAQHLAMVDDIYDASNAGWFANRWKIVFSGTGYTVSSGSQQATDPLTKSTFGDLTEYTLDSVVLSGGCSTSIIFDNFGKPHSSLVSADGNVMTTPCIITLSGNGKTATVSVQPQTGYATLDSVI